MSLIELLSTVASDWRFAVATVLVGAAGFALVIRRLGRPSEPDPLARIVLWERPGLPPSALPRRSVTERRRQGRWTPRAITVTLTNPAETETYGVAIVADRSAEGIGLIGPKECAPGTRLLIRPTGGTEKPVGTEVEVRSCQWVNDAWMIGCRFVSTPSWAIAMHLG